MNPEEIEATRKAAEKSIVTMDGGSGESSLVTKGEMGGILQDLITMGLIYPRAERGLSELKLELMLNDVKLEGSKNYLSWSRMAQLIPKMKGVKHYLQETCVEPANMGSTDWRVWNITNSVVVAWLLTSVSPSIARMVEAISSATVMWKTLRNMYSGDNNMMMMVEVQGKVDALK